MEQLGSQNMYRTYKTHTAGEFTCNDSHGDVHLSYGFGEGRCNCAQANQEPTEHDDRPIAKAVAHHCGKRSCGKDGANYKHVWETLRNNTVDLCTSLNYPFTVVSFLQQGHKTVSLAAAGLALVHSQTASVCTRMIFWSPFSRKKCESVHWVMKWWRCFVTGQSEWISSQPSQQSAFLSQHSSARSQHKCQDEKICLEVRICLTGSHWKTTICDMYV